MQDPGQYSAIPTRINMGFLCHECDREFSKKRNLKRHKIRVHKKAATQRTIPATSERLPSGRLRTVTVTKTASDIVPWTDGQNLLLLAPVTVCGIVVPRQWNGETTRGVAWLDCETLRHFRQQFHPVLAEVQKAATERAEAVKSRATEVIEKEVIEISDTEDTGVVAPDSDSDWDYI